MCNILHLYNSASKLSSSLATRSFCPWVTWARHEIDYTSSSGFQLKNDWSCNSNPNMPSQHTQGRKEHQLPFHYHPYWLATFCGPTHYPHQPHIQFVSVWVFVSDCLALKMKVIWSFRTPGTAHPTRRCYIPEGGECQQHCCKASLCFLESATIQWMDAKLGS